MRYAWMMKGLAKDTDAQVIGEHLEKLVDQFNEHLTPEEIVADARNTRSPLHSIFTWDENEAADKWRQRQARNIMATLVVAKRGKPTKRQAFVLVRHDKHGRRVYLSIRSALGRPDMREQIINQALTQLNRWIMRWGGRQELAFAERSVERIRRKINAELLSLTS